MKKTIPTFNSDTALALKALLDAPDQQYDSLSYCECVGFMFVIACSPEPVNPSKWLPVIFDPKNNGDANHPDTTKSVELLIALYNEMNRQVQEADVKLLPGCKIREDSIDNFADDAPIHQWAKGFILGHAWQNKLFAHYVPAELQNQFGGQMMVLSFFASEETSRSAVMERLNEEITFEQIATDMINIFRDAMIDTSQLALTIQQTLEQKHSHSQTAQKNEKVARNAACPCGSGKKYKKCCGGVLH